MNATFDTFHGEISKLNALPYQNFPGRRIDMKGGNILCPVSLAELDDYKIIVQLVVKVPTHHIHHIFNVARIPMGNVSIEHSC
jgi:hypothetical protein